MNIAKQLYSPPTKKKPQKKTGNPAETADRLARLYHSTVHGPEVFLEVFEALTDKFSDPEREEVLDLFNQRISKK